MTAALPHIEWMCRVSTDVRCMSCRRAFYKATLDLLDRGRGQQYKLNSVYVWSVGSFDIFAVHPVSSNSQGTFADQYIIDLVRKHNGVNR